MKISLLSFFILTISSLHLTAQKMVNVDLDKSPLDPCELPQYRLVFEDEFNGNTLNEDYWWSYFPFGDDYSDDCYYCRTMRLSSVYKDENLEISKGTLKLHIKKEKVEWYDSDNKWIGYDHTAGVIFSKMTFDDYGKYEIRCKINKGAGLLSVFWVGGGGASEIDIFEIGGHATNEIHSSIIRWDGDDDEVCTEKMDCDIDLSQDFHVYSMEYDPFSIKFYLDGTLLAWKHRLKDFCAANPCDPIPHNRYEEFLCWPPLAPVRVIANNGVTKLKEKCRFCSDLEESTTFPNTMEIDYIKVYQRCSALNLEVPENETFSLNGNHEFGNIFIRSGGTLNIENAVIKIGSKGKIILDEGSTLNLSNTSVQAICDQWEGIDARRKGRVNITKQSKLSHAKVAINLKSWSNLNLSNSGIENCEKGIYLNNISTETTISNNSWIKNNGVGIKSVHARGVSIRDARFIDNNKAIEAKDTDMLVASGNLFQGGYSGITHHGAFSENGGITIGDEAGLSNQFSDISLYSIYLAENEKESMSKIINNTFENAGKLFSVFVDKQEKVEMKNNEFKKNQSKKNENLLLQFRSLFR